MSDLYDEIRRGDRVTIINRLGQQRTGRAVMLGPAGWVLDMGGRYGTPAIATPQNIIGVRKAKTRTSAGSFVTRRSRPSRRSRPRHGDTRGFNKYYWKPGDHVRRKGSNMVGEVVRVTPTMHNHLISDGVSRAHVRVRWSNGYEATVPEGGLVPA